FPSGSFLQASSTAWNAADFKRGARPRITGFTPALLRIRKKTNAARNQRRFASQKNRIRISKSIATAPASGRQSGKKPRPRNPAVQSNAAIAKKKNSVTRTQFHFGKMRALYASRKRQQRNMSARPIARITRRSGAN